ncbi:peroxisomal leader peptide-processing protease-like isoform X2 [Lasioglossum baleicum]|uniref:peroxisomal leader peptide-processing protease-like isoform X2 n=1 Tax=Lasioglossum baleicum TaxID=434251 RepID=UPI003FCD4D19
MHVVDARVFAKECSTGTFRISNGSVLALAMNAPGSVFISYPGTMTDATVPSQGYSGISIANHWVLAHGSILSDKAQRSRKLLDFVNASNPGEVILLEPHVHGKLFDDVTFLIHHNPGSSIESGKPLAIWKCPLLSDTMESLLRNWNFQNNQRFDRIFLPVLLLIACDTVNTTERAANQQLESELTGRGQNGEIRLESLGNGGKVRDILIELAKQSATGRPAKGSTVEIFSTPFGNPFFSDTMARGIVGNLLGTKECLMVIDAAVFPGCQGAPVYLADNRARKTVCGMVIASSCWLHGERIDYTFAINLLPSLNQVLQTRVRRNESLCLTSLILPFTQRRDRNDKIGILERSVAIVRCGPNWGTGILVDAQTGTFITCAHVVAAAPERKIELVSYIASRADKSEWTARAKLIYKTPGNKPYDIAVLKIDLKCTETSMKAIKLADRPAVNGEPIFSIGFPFCLAGRATISNGIISKLSECMLQTNCCAQSGVSGGPIVRPSSLEMLGMIVCNTVSTNDATTYPRLCMAIPTSVFKEPLDNYLRTADPKMLENLTQHDQIIEGTWNLRSPLLRSNI